MASAPPADDRSPLAHRAPPLPPVGADAEPDEREGAGEGGSWRTGSDDRWHVALWRSPLPTEALAAWAHRRGCGAVVSFAGTTRDHGLAPDGGLRTGVTLLEYEAYEGPALDRLALVAQSVLARWEDCGAVVVVHRLGPVPLGEASVLVVVAAAHRDAAFAAARHAIDTTKATVPIWKREYHDAGADWGADVTPLEGVPPLDHAVVRPTAPVADTGGAARRAASAGAASPHGGGPTNPEPQEQAWAT